MVENVFGGVLVEVPFLGYHPAGVQQQNRYMGGSIVVWTHGRIHRGGQGGPDPLNGKLQVALGFVRNIGYEYGTASRSNQIIATVPRCHACINADGA